MSYGHSGGPPPGGQWGGQPPGYPPPGGGYQPGYPPPPPQYGHPPAQGPRGPSLDPLSVLSLVLAIVSGFLVCCPYAGIIASLAPLIIGVASVLRIRSRPTELHGQWLAMAGAILAACVLGVSIMATFDFVNFRRDKKERETSEEGDSSERPKRGKKASKKVTYGKDVERVDIEATVDVDTYKRNLKDWDAARGKPDPMVTITVEGTEYSETQSVKNRYTHTFRFDNVPVKKKRDTIVFKVQDKDVSVHDFIGEARVRYRPGISFDNPVLEAGDLMVEFEPR